MEPETKKQRTESASADGHGDGKNDEKESNTSAFIRDAKHFILAAIEFYSEHDKHFEFLSEHLLSDRDIAFAALHYTRISADELPLEVQKDKSFLLRVLNHAYYPQDARYLIMKDEVLTQDPELWRAMIKADPDKDDYSIMERDGWDLSRAPPSVLSDHALMVIACNNIPEDIAKVSGTLLSSQGFLQEAINANPRVLLYLPPNAKTSLPDELIETTAKKLFSRFSFPRYNNNERNSQVELLDSLGSEMYSRRYVQRAWFAAGGPFLGDYFPSHINSDRELMSIYCENHSASVGKLSATLQSDKDFFSELIPKNLNVLFHIPRPAAQAHPELITDNIKRYLESNRYYELHGSRCGKIVDLLGPEIYTTDSFLKVWFASGGPFLARKFPHSLKDDKEVFTAIAENAPRAWCRYSFKHASCRLKSDKEFILKAVANSPWILKNASPELRRDFLVVATALAAIGTRRSNAVTIIFLKVGLDKDEFVAELKEKVLLHDSFVTTVLPCLTLPQARVGAACPLSVLNHGDYKQRIAAFLGVPVGKELGLYRRAIKVCEDHDEDDIRRFFGDTSESSMDSDLFSDSD